MMPLPTFDPSIRPSPGASHKPEVSLHEAQFGDGYTQASPVGLNHIRRVVTLKWDALTLAQVQELDAFFTDRGGHSAFWYRPYGFAEALKWTCREWSGSTAAPHTFIATLKQSFTLET